MKYIKDNIGHNIYIMWWSMYHDSKTPHYCK